LYFLDAKTRNKITMPEELRKKLLPFFV